MDINDEPDKIDSVQDPTAHDPDSTTEVGIMAEDKTENQIAYENDDNRNAGDKIINEAIIDTNKPTKPATKNKEDDIETHMAKIYSARNNYYILCARKP